MNNQVNPACDKWSSFLTIGIILILLGTIALGSAFITTLATVFLFGLLIAAGGIAQVVHAFWTPEWKGFFVQLLIGILSAVVGWLMVTNPLTGAVSLTLLLATLFIAIGLFRISTSLFTSVEHWGWLLFAGIVSLALGILILSQWPAASLWVLGLFVAIELIFSGWAYVMFAFGLRNIVLQMNHNH